MALKKPRQGQLLREFKVKELLDLSSLAADVAQKFVAAMKEASGKVRYTGSAYHRAAGSKEGPKVQRAGLTSKCPASWTNVEATRVLRESIVAGRVSQVWDHGFPRYVWHLDDEILYEARLTNSGNGEYHAYPLEDKWQWPKNLR